MATGLRLTKPSNSYDTERDPAVALWKRVFLQCHGNLSD